MKKFRIINWLILAGFILIFYILTMFNIEGFWRGFSIGASFVVLIGEVHWLLKGKDIKGYALKKESKA